MAAETLLGAAPAPRPSAAAQSCFQLRQTLPEATGSCWARVPRESGRAPAAKPPSSRHPPPGSRVPPAAKPPSAAKSPPGSPGRAPAHRARHRLPAERGSLADDVALKQRQHRTAVLGSKNKTRTKQNSTTTKHVNIFLCWNHPKSIFNMQYTEMVLQKHRPRLPLLCIIHFCMKKAILCPCKRRERRGGETRTTLAHYKNTNDTMRQMDCNF